MKSWSVDRALGIFAFLNLALFMFLPLLVISIYISEPRIATSSGVTEATVGVGVILRAITQRLFRAGASNAVRLTFGTMTRTMARTAVNRTIRVFVRSSAGSLAKELAGNEGATVGPSAVASGRAILLGIVATSFSFWGVLMIKSNTGNTPLGESLGLSLAFMLVAAAVPLVVLGLCCLLSARLFGTQYLISTGLDGLLIQGYFTFSGSFLPMTSDFEFRGSTRACSYSSIFTLSLMMIAFAAFGILGAQRHDSALVFLSAMFLAYVFVYSFPVKPLLGYCIWNHSKLLWLILFLPVLAAFLFIFPQSLAALL